MFIVAGIVIGYYGDICYSCMARKKYLVDKMRKIVGTKIDESEKERTIQDVAEQADIESGDIRTL